MRRASVKAAKPEALSQAVYGKLLERIMDGAWQPGAIFDRRSVAKELGVSLAPVAEALIRLQEDGFIISIPRKGTMLRPSDPRKLYESLMLREAVECQAARMAFAKIKGSEAALRVLALNADAAESMAQRREADAAFHRALVALAGVATLSELLERLVKHMIFDELHLLNLNSVGVILADTHSSLLDGLLATQSPEAAAERVRQHLRAGRDSLLQRFESGA